MSVSKKVVQFMEQGSWIRKMFEEGISLKQKYGADNVSDLSLGNPIMEPPSEFFDELLNIAKTRSKGMHRYMPNSGYTDTRSAIASQLYKETGIEFTSEEIIMTCGAGGALNIIFKTLLDPGDEVVIFSPYFVEYHFYADNHGGVCKISATDENFTPDLESFSKLINAKTKIILINSPNNPTGAVYSKETLSNLAKIINEKERLYERDMYLVSDEPYRKLLFDGLDYPQVFPHHVRSIVATSHSKDLAIPGERIGFVAVNPLNERKSELMDGLTFSTRILGFVNAPALMQHIVGKLQSVTVDIKDYQRKRNFLYEELTLLGYDVVKPQGAFYMFPRSPIEDDVEFVAELQRYNVLVVPGRGFGAPGFFRISFCVDDSTLQRSIDGFRKAISNISS